MPPNKDEHQIIKELLEENQRLLNDNNRILKNMLKRANWSFFFQVLWVLVILGVPLALYYYGIKPYFDSVGDSFQSFGDGLQNVPGWNQFYDAVTGSGNNKE